MHRLSALLCLIVATESRDSKDIVFLDSIQPLDLSTAGNETKTEYLGRVEDSENGTLDTNRDSRGLMKKFGYFGKGGGLISGSGTLAASNSLRIFGKVMNTALSVSYGHVDELDAVPEIESDSDVGHSEEKQGRLKPEIVAGVNHPLKSIRKQFIKNHNAQVSRLNHKFLKADSWSRSS